MLILGIPLLDTILVTIQRIREGRSPFRADKNHIHHKFLVLGFDHYEAVFLIYLLHSLLVVFAYLLRFESDFLIVLVSGVFSLGVISFFKLASATGWRRRRCGRCCLPPRRSRCGTSGAGPAGGGATARGWASACPAGTTCAPRRSAAPSAARLFR